AVGYDVPKQGRHHGVVDETRLDAHAALACLVAVKRVDERYRCHAQLCALLARELAQSPIERARADKERRFQQHAVYLALENSGLAQRQKTLDQHLARAVQADVERAAFAQLRRSGVGGLEPSGDLTKVSVVLVPQDERMRHRIAERPDPELQGAAV